MHAYVVSDNPAVSNKVREKLVRAGHDCPDSHVVGLSFATKFVNEADLIVVVMSPNTTNSLAALSEVRTGIKGSGQQRFLLAVGPPDARLILRSIQLADEYVDESDISEAMDAILAKIMSDGATQAQPGKIVAVLAPSGGSGGSIIAVNVATMLAKEHRSCALLDLKLGAGVLDALMDLRPTHTLADLCRNADRLDRGMFEKLLMKHSSGVHLLAPPNSFNDVAYVTAQGVRQALAMSRALFPFVVVDLDRNFTEEQLEVLKQADVILVVLRLDFTSLRNTRQAMDHMEQFGIDRQRARLVINRKGQAREIRLAQAEEALGMKVFKQIPEDPSTVNRAINNGVPIVLDSPKTPVAKSLMELARDLNGPGAGK